MSVSFYNYIDHADDGIEFIDGPNFANSNADQIVRSLGYENGIVDGFGKFDLDDFEGRVLTALAVGGATADDGQPNIESGGPGTGQARMIDCGIRPGYFANAYTRLAELCAELRSRGIEEVIAA